MEDRKLVCKTDYEAAKARGKDSSVLVSWIREMLLLYDLSSQIGRSILLTHVVPTGRYIIILKF